MSIECSRYSINLGNILSPQIIPITLLSKSEGSVSIRFLLVAMAAPILGNMTVPAGAVPHFFDAANSLET